MTDAARAAPAEAETPKCGARKPSSMSLTEAGVEFVGSLLEMPVRFAEVAAHDPLSAVLMAVGAVLTAVPVLALGYLSLGAVLSLFSVDSSPPQPPEA